MTKLYKINGKSAEEIRMCFHVENDFNKEEEEVKKAKWLGHGMDK